MNKGKDIYCNLCKMQELQEAKQPQQADGPLWDFEPYNGCGNVFISTDLSRLIESLPTDERKNREKRPFTLFRYAKFSQLRNDISHSLLKFPSPSSWEDPFEAQSFKFMNEDNDNPCPITGGICFTTDGVHNEDYAWKVYGAGESIVRCEFDFEKFAQQLQASSDKINNAVDFYISLMSYMLDRKKIEHILLGLKKAEKTCLDCMLRILTLKRKSFLGESEVRVFAVVRNSHSTIEETCSEGMGELPKPNLSANKPDFRNIFPFTYENCMKRITLPPLQPSVVSPLADYYHQWQENQNKSMQDAFDNGIDLADEDWKEEKADQFKCKIQQCHLYDIEKIIKDKKTNKNKPVKP